MKKYLMMAGLIGLTSTATPAFAEHRDLELIVGLASVLLADQSVFQASVDRRYSGTRVSHGYPRQQYGYNNARRHKYEHKNKHRKHHRRTERRHDRWHYSNDGRRDVYYHEDHSDVHHRQHDRHHNFHDRQRQHR